MLQVVALGLGAVELAVQIGARQVIDDSDRAQLDDPLGILERGQRLVALAMQFPQIARESLHHLPRTEGRQIAGLQLRVGPELIHQQLAAVVHVQATTAEGFEQMIRAWHAQEEMSGKADTLQVDLQAPGQFQSHQGDRQRLAASPRQDLVEQGSRRVQGPLGRAKTGIAQLPQQGLGPLGVTGIAIQAGDQAQCQVVQRVQQGRGIDLFVVFGRDPQGGFQQPGIGPVQAGEAGKTRVHGRLQSPRGLFLRF